MISTRPFFSILNAFAFTLFFQIPAFAQTNPPSAEEVEIHCQAKMSPQGESISIHCDPKDSPAELSTNPTKILEPSPFQIVLQTGGYQGLVAPGISLRFLTRNEISFLGGYVPEVIDGGRLWQLSSKYEIHPFNSLFIQLPRGEKIAINPLHLGAAIIYGIHKDLFVSNPSQYPRHYYTPTAIRYSFEIGTSVTYRRVTLYVEYVASDVGILAYFYKQNRLFFADHYGFFGLPGIGTLGLGAKINLRRSSKR